MRRVRQPQGQATHLLPGRTGPPCSAEVVPALGEKQPALNREEGGVFKITQLNSPKPGDIDKSSSCACPNRPTVQTNTGKQKIFTVFLNCFINPRPSAALLGNRQLHIKPLYFAAGSQAAQGRVSNAQRRTQRKCIETCMKTAAVHRNGAGGR